MNARSGVEKKIVSIFRARQRLRGPPVLLSSPRERETYVRPPPTPQGRLVARLAQAGLFKRFGRLISRTAWS